MDLSTLIIAVLVAASTSIIGVFLVLRKMSMMTDAISHTVLLGIVLAYLVVGNLNSPLLVIGATVIGVVTVYLIELLIRTNKTTKDAAIGVVFPLLFSIAIVIINTKFRNTHLDIDAVLLGKLEIAVFDRLIIFGKDIGPKSLYMLLLVLILNVSFILIFYKELKIVSFDSALATVLGFSVGLIHYLLMTLISFTAVVAFDAVGSILVIALMVGPVVTALLITKDLVKTIVYTLIIGVLNSVLGYGFAYFYDLTISGTIATFTLITFLAVFIFAPKKGLISIMVRRNKQKYQFALMNLLYHIINHENEDLDYKLSVEIIQEDFRLNDRFFNKIIQLGLKTKTIERQLDKVRLTKHGREAFTSFCKDNNLCLLGVNYE